MIDIAYIDELRELEDGKEAKEKLAEYAKTFGITVRKSRTFENMVLDIQEKLEELSNEPMPDDNEGMSIVDLISANIKADPVADTVEFKNEQPAEYVPVNIDININTENKEVLILNVETQQTESVIKEEPSDNFKLPENFSPTVILIGKNPGYCTLPWWIYEWITKNPDWKENPNKFPHHYGMETLYSLIYYINKNGSVTIRETRNSQFHVLE